MHHTNSIARAFFVSNGILVLLLLLFPTSSVVADETYCDQKLGRNYDKQTAEEKMARMNMYFNCRHSQDFRFLQSKHKDMLIGIQKWKNRANRVTHNSLTTKRTILATELKTVHGTERGDLEANYGNQYTELEAARSADNGMEIASKRREITLTYRSERRDMKLRQKEEVNLLGKTIKQCSLTVTNEINQLSNEDTKNISQQFLEKTARLKREYGDLKAAPMTISLNDYAARQSSAPAPTGSVSDGDPVGSITELEGSGSVTRKSGETVDARPGTPIYQGDIVETNEDSRCNIVFKDETSLAIGDDARLEIDEYVYDPESDSGEGNFSVLRGIFVFISGLIGRQEPRDVDVPIGYTGIRG